VQSVPVLAVVLGKCAKKLKKHANTNRLIDQKYQNLFAYGEI